MPFIEPLETRIAPAAVVNPLPDLYVGPGNTGADVDLTRVFDSAITDNGHTIVTFTTNFDADLQTVGIQPSAPIVIELFDQEAPLTVQNFLRYVRGDGEYPDYLGTIFHRAVPGFVLQGGGFEVTAIDEHIETPFNVHNEFSATRSNLEGTIAMAKTGLSPHTATSEWFFNLANNSGNLDSQNGGFTVFARVVSGLDIAKAIVALPRTNQGGSLTDLPVQNYNADPDNNPDTPAPEPTPEQLVQITGSTITPAPSGSSSGITFSFHPAVDVVDAATGQPSDLVAGSIVQTATGPRLSLQYKPHTAGVVNVTVRGNDGTETTADTFQINLQPNLVAEFEGDPFDGIIIAGDTKNSPLVIGNNGGGWAVGNVNVKVYLSEVRAGVDPNGVIVQPSDDILIGEFANVPIDLEGGGKQTLMRDLQVPRQLVTGGIYKILVQVTPAAGVSAERFSDDNVALDSDSHSWDNRFGTFSVPGFGEREDAVLTYQEADGDMVRMSITRGGGMIEYDGELADLAIMESKPRSVLSASLTSGAGEIDLHNVEIFEFIREVNLAKASVSGSVSASGGLLKLRLGDVHGDGRLSLGRLPEDSTNRPELIFGRVSDFSVESLDRVESIRAIEWLETAGDTSRIEVPSLGKLIITGRDGSSGSQVRGDLEADVRLRGSQSMSRLDVAGFFRNAEVVTTGSVGKVIVGGLDHVSIFVGLAERPDSRSDFREERTLGSLVIRGVRGSPDAFIDSDVAAATIGQVMVSQIEADAETGTFGIFADAIKSYNRGAFTAQERSSSQLIDRLGDYRVRVF